MYKIKQIPKDFLVKEIPDIKLEEDGEYRLFTLTKKNLTTQHSIDIISDKLNIHKKNISFAGTKDKKAITSQTISIRYINKDKVLNMDPIKGIQLEYIGNSSSPISLGDLKENRFLITVRDLEDKTYNKLPITRIPNYFGTQRFSENNAQAGKLLVIKNFQKALSIIQHKTAKDYLEFNPTDFAGALRTIPLKIRKLYVHAYQSYIFNKTIKEYIKTSPYKNQKIPIIGFTTEIPKDDLGNIIKDILKKENITLRDFIIRQIPEISSEGSQRDLFINLDKIRLSFEDDDLNDKRYKARLEFSLPKGSYATVVIDYLFSKDFNSLY